MHAMLNAYTAVIPLELQQFLLKCTRSTAAICVKPILRMMALAKVLLHDDPMRLCKHALIGANTRQ